MNYLGIDYGKKRIGTAFAQASSGIAFPEKVIQNGDGALKELLNLVVSRKINQVVVGRSHNLHGEPNKIQKDIEIFKKKLRELLDKEGIDADITEEDEFLTSSHVEVKNDMLDASAAALILQRYLDKEKYRHDNH